RRSSTTSRAWSRRAPRTSAGTSATSRCGRRKSNRAVFTDPSAWRDGEPYRNPMAFVDRGARARQRWDPREAVRENDNALAIAGDELLAVDLRYGRIDDLVSVLGAAPRLGYGDGHAGSARAPATRSPTRSGLASWTGLQQLQLRQAYVTGRQHGVNERRIG